MIFFVFSTFFIKNSFQKEELNKPLIYIIVGSNREDEQLDAEKEFTSDR